jgi:chorismate synthase
VTDTPFDTVNPQENDFIAVREAAFPTISEEAGKAMTARLTEAKESGDSVGGTIECAAIGVPAGLGDPLFNGMENRISRLIFGLGGVRGIEFGRGFAASDMLGSEHNDPYCTDGTVILTETNNSGGIQAGITNGMPIIFRVAFKPTASISIPQKTVSLSKMTNETLVISGRHDPCIAIRALPCVEAVASIALFDAWMQKEADKRL